LQQLLALPSKYIMLLLAVWLVFSHCKKLIYMILAANQQYYVSGHDNYSAEPPPPVLPSTENAQVKKYQIRARHSNKKFLCIN
jgi:hypothetical protein